MTITPSMLWEACYWAAGIGLPLTAFATFTYAALTTPLPERRKGRKA